MKKLLYLILILLFGFNAASAQDCTDVTVVISTGSWAEEISWALVDSQNGDLVFLSSEEYENNQLYTYAFCVQDGCFELQMFDGFGDGWNGGVLTVVYNGSETYTFDQFTQGQQFYTSFGINSDEPCDTEYIYGCTDPNALNYNPDATIDDNSCQYPVLGCMDPAAENYNPWATEDDGSCVYPLECDSGQTLATVYVCVFGSGQNIGFELSDDAGNVLISQNGYNNGAIDYTDLCLQEGVCYTITATNLEGPFGWYGGYFWVNTASGTQLITGELADDQSSATFDFSIDGTCGEVYGCTDPDADNYNPDATIDDGSCYSAANNDLCADAMPLQEGMILIDNTGAVVNEDIYGECWGFGNGEGEQSSVWFSFITPNEPAQITITAIQDGSGTLTDTQFGLFEDCGGDMIYCDGNSGVGLMSQFDFECGDLEPNTEYILMVDGYFGDAGTCYLDYQVTLGCDDPILGCTDPNALNFNPDATVDNGSCIYQTDSCDQTLVEFYLGTGSFGSEVSFVLTDNDGNVYAQFDGFASNSDYYLSACIADGCYTLILLDSWGDGWNGAYLSVLVNGEFVATEVTIPYGFEGEVTFGVNDPDCIGNTDVFGCTDPAAMNYNPLANMDDGSCYYDTTSTDCYAEFFLAGIDQEGDVVYLYNASGGQGPMEYIWDWGDGSVSYEQYPTHQYVEGGEYMVCLTVYAADGCTSTYCEVIYYDPDGFVNDGFGTESPNGSNTIWHINVVQPEATGLDELEVSDLAIYPVPAQETLYLKFLVDNYDQASLRIMDITGKVLQVQTYTPAAGVNLVELDVNALAKGSYLLEMTQDGQRLVRRFEVMK